MAIEFWLQTVSYLQAYPVSGRGAGSVFLSPTGGLSAGTYTATVIFQSADATPQMIQFPITFKN